ncbi:MAG: DUF6090 family protein [Bacteroidota bacterium]
MIKFFRKIRQQLLAENRFRKYLLYAIGEIALVMIGILLAFQVNNWQAKRTRAVKELSYLKDIKSNLSDDIKAIDRVVEFNKTKSLLADSMFYTLDRYSDPEIYMPKIIRYMYTLTVYDVFEPNRIAFDNMVAAENVNLITNGNLRSRLSQYYKKEFNTTTQENVKQRARQLGDYVAIAAFNKQSIKSLVNYNSSLMDISEVEIHKDSKVYAYLFSMLMTTQSHTEILMETHKDIEELIELINQQIQ